MKLRTLILILLLTLAVGCVKEKAETSILKDNLYENSVYGFSMKVPVGWKVSEGVNVGGISTIVIFGGPVEDAFMTNVNIKTENVAGFSNKLSDYIDASKELLSQGFALKDFIMIDEGEIQINGQDAYFLEYAFNDVLPIKIKQVILMNKDNAYIITFTSLIKNFDKHVGEFDKSMSTFLFTR